MSSVKGSFVEKMSKAIAAFMLAVMAVFGLSTATAGAVPASAPLAMDVTYKVGHKASVKVTGTCVNNDMVMTVSGQGLGKGDWSMWQNPMMGAGGDHDGSFTISGSSVSSWTNLQVTGTKVTNGTWTKRIINSCKYGLSPNLCKFEFGSKMCAWGITEADGTRVDVRTRCNPSNGKMYVTVAGAKLGKGTYAINGGQKQLDTQGEGSFAAYPELQRDQYVTLTVQAKGLSSKKYEDTFGFNC